MKRRHQDTEASLQAGGEGGGTGEAAASSDTNAAAAAAVAAHTTTAAAAAAVVAGGGSAKLQKVENILEQILPGLTVSNLVDDNLEPMTDAEKRDEAEQVVRLQSALSTQIVQFKSRIAARSQKIVHELLPHKLQDILKTVKQIQKLILPEELPVVTPLENSKSSSASSSIGNGAAANAAAATASASASASSASSSGNIGDGKGDDGSSTTPIPGSAESSPVIIEAMGLIQQHLLEMVEAMNTLAAHFRLILPRMSDQTTLATSVKQATTEILYDGTSSALSVLDSFMRYFLDRGQLVRKCLRYPQVEDYRRGMAALDMQMLTQIKNAATDLAHNCGIVADFVHKNLQHLSAPKDQKDSFLLG